MNTFVTGRRLARELGEWRSNAPAYRSLAERIRVLLMDGRLSSGAKLPAERELSQALDLSRTTVAAAYSKLREDGFLDSVRGSGSTLRLPGLERGEHGLHPGLTLDFTKATTPAYPGLQAAYASALSELPRYLSHDGFDMVGLPDLREAIAQSFCDRGLPTSADQIMVTVGAQHALNLVARTLYSPANASSWNSPRIRTPWTRLRPWALAYWLFPCGRSPAGICNRHSCKSAAPLRAWPT